MGVTGSVYSPPPGFVSAQVRVMESKGEKVSNPSTYSYIGAGIYSARETTAPKIKKAIHITQAVLEGTDDFVRTAAEVAITARNIFSESLIIHRLCETMRPVFEKVKAGGIILSPFYLFNLADGIYLYAKHRIDTGDFLINTFGSIGRFACSVGTLLRDLVVLGVAPSEILKFLWPFDLIGIAIGIVSITSHARGWAQTAQFAKEFEAVLGSSKETDFTNEEIEKLIKCFEEKDPIVVSKAFEYDSQELIQKIKIVAEKAKKYGNLTGDPKSKEANDELDDAIKTLRGRISTKIRLHQVFLVASVVDTIANAAFLTISFLTPICPVLASAAPVLYALKGAAGVLSLGGTGYKIYKNRQFMNSRLMVGKPDDVGVTSDIPPPPPPPPPNFGARAHRKVLPKADEGEKEIRIPRVIPEEDEARKLLREGLGARRKRFSPDEDEDEDIAPKNNASAEESVRANEELEKEHRRQPVKYSELSRKQEVKASQPLSSEEVESARNRLKKMKKPPVIQKAREARGLQAVLEGAVDRRGS